MGLKARLVLAEPPELTVADGGVAQLTYRDPGVGARQTVNGSWKAVETGIDLALGSDAAVRRILVPAGIRLTVNLIDGTLSYAGPVEGVGRGDLLRLVPEWESEQLLDPVPGDLHIVFQRKAL